jgi:hypothetical protein
MKILLFACLLPALASTSLAAPQYGARKDIATGFKNLYGMAVADFNGDGKPDIAVTDNAAKNLVVYLNDGNGSFGPPKSMPLNMNAVGPGQIIAADFNEDGKQDIIVGTVGGLQSVLLLLGNGDGTFTQQPDLPNSFGFETAVAVDINRDGYLDLILGGNGSMSLYLGDGRGNFQPQTFSNQGTGGLYTSIATGDFNKDNKLDFVAARPAGIWSYAGNGDGTFGSPTNLTTNALPSPRSVAVADFDGDGNADLVIGSNFAAAVIPGNGDGTFDLSKSSYLYTPTFTANLNAYGTLVAAMDMDGDKKTDVVVAEDLSKTINVFLNDGTGKFPQQAPDFTAAVDPGSEQLALADLNGDGLPDIIFASNVTQNISVFLSIKPKTTPTITLTSSAASQFVGTSVGLTVKVTGSTSTTSTGTVSLLEGSTSLGQQALDSNGQAIFSLSNLSVGQHNITAVYAGDTNYNTITSSAVTQAITDMQVSSTASQTVTAGGTATYSLTVTPAGGLTGSVSVTCSQLPSLVTCDPITVPLVGQPVTTTLTVHTTAPVTSRHLSSVKTAGLGLLSIALTTLLPLRRRKPLQLLFAAVALLVAGSVIGCSGGSTSISNPPVTVTPGTPQGTTPFTITSSITLGGQTLTRTTTATLVVQ